MIDTKAVRISLQDDPARPLCRYQFICTHRAAYGVKRLCRVLAVRRQGFYEWLAAAPGRGQRAGAEEKLAGEIAGIHGEHRGAYGSPRVAVELRRRGWRVNRKRVERIMRQRGIVGIARRRRRSLTKQDTQAAAAADLIGRDFSAAAPGERFVGDITYLPTEEGWLYLATTIDLYNREVTGHAMAEHMRAELVSDAVTLAHRRGLVRPEAIFHSDRGAQYSSTQFRTTLATLGMRASMGRVGSCYDNAVAESFFAALKAEIGTRVWATRAEARKAVFAYLTYYNLQRLHSTIKYQTPYEARVCYRQQHALAA